MLINPEPQEIIRAFKVLIKKIVFNNILGDDPSCHGHASLDHKEVRAIAKTALINEVSDYFINEIGCQINYYLWVLHSDKLNHKERKTIAREILKLVEAQELRVKIEDSEDTIEVF